MKRLPTLVALAVGSALLVSCGTLQDQTDSAETSDPEPGNQSTPSAQTNPTDEFQPLSVNMVAQSGTHFPDGIEGISFGCSDTLVTINTVPIRAESPQEHVASAIRFLLDDSQYYHGAPAVTNSLTLSETLELDNVELDRNSVDIDLSGDVVVQSQCEAYRIQAQLYGTVASTSGIEDISITINDDELNDVLGLEPFDTAQLVSDAD